MRAWCIYIDEAGVNDEPQFIYVAICIPFDSQQEFLNNYSKIVHSLVYRDGSEIKYGPLLNEFDRNYERATEDVCYSLLDYFFKIDGATIIRVKAIRNEMRARGADLRKALFRKTLTLCKEFLPRHDHAMILHDEIDGRALQPMLLDTFNSFNEGSLTGTNFQSCIFVHSNENPFIQFADFIAAVCYRYYYFQQREEKEYSGKKLCASLVNRLFNRINARFPPILELSEHKSIKDNPRREQALQLAETHDIDLSTAYQVVDKKFTLEEALREKRQKQERKEQALQLAETHDIDLSTAYQVVDKKFTLEEALERKQN